MTPVAEKAAPIPGAAARVLEIVYRNTAQPEWTVATLLQGSNEVVGVCWSKGGRFGREFKDQDWFILPGKVAENVLASARALEAERQEKMLQGYREQAADVEAEAEALEWCEALIGDAFEEE